MNNPSLSIALSRSRSVSISGMPTNSKIGQTKRSRQVSGKEQKGIEIKGMRSENDLVDYFHKPGFRKLFIDGLNFYAVRIPTAFVDLLDEEVPDTATLKGSSGGCWHVKVVKSEEDISLEDGWEKFRDDNKLGRGDVLLFRYFGNWCFHVEVFGPNGLEKKMKDFGEKGKGIDQRKVVINDKKSADSRENDEVGPLSAKGKRGRPRKDSSPSPSKQAQPGTKASNTGRANWKDPNISKLFIDLCLQELAGARSDKGNLRITSWKKIRMAFKEAKNIDLTELQLINHWDYQKRKYMVWSKMVTEAGHTHYDPVENKINWSEEQWKEHLKVNPEAKVFLNQSLEYPREMMLLFDP